MNKVDIGEYNTLVNKYNEIYKENKQLKECYCNRTDCSGRIKDSKEYDSVVQQMDLYKSIVDKLEKWLKEDLGVTYTAESRSGKVFTTAKEVVVRGVLKKINELKGADE